MRNTTGDRPALLRLAEAPNLYEPLAAGEQLIVRDNYVLFLGTSEHPAHNSVQHLRLSSESVDATVAEVRALALAHARSALMWQVSSLATPGDLSQRLLHLGMTPANPPLAAVMVLRDPPPPPAQNITVSRVETLSDFRMFVSITHEVFGLMDLLSDELKRIDREGAEKLSNTRFMRYLAWLDGEPVGAATATFTDVGVILHSGSTKEGARGRGVYRALVAARWDEAVRRGTPFVITRAGPMSRPILERSGFELLAEIRFLVDQPV